MLSPLAQAALPYLMKTAEFEKLLHAKIAIGAALSKEQQIFVSNNLNSLIPFMESSKGRELLSGFVDAWENKDKPPVPIPIKEVEPEE